MAIDTRHPREIQADIRRGALAVCGLDGVRVVPESRPRDRDGFAFMQSEVSSEKWLKVAVRKVAELIRSARSRGERVVLVAGPVVVHTGGVGPLASLIRRGWVDALLSGNALAVHDAEQALFGTEYDRIRRWLHLLHVQSVTGGNAEPAPLTGSVKRNAVMPAQKPSLFVNECARILRLRHFGFNEGSIIAMAHKTDLLALLQFIYGKSKRLSFCPYL